MTRSLLVAATGLLLAATAHAQVGSSSSSASFGSSFGSSAAPIDTFPYFEDFEASSGGWDSSGFLPSWGWLIPTGRAIPGAQSGLRAWITGRLKPGTTAANLGEVSFLTSPLIDATLESRDIVLRFSHTHVFDTDTGGHVEVSLDGGPWTLVGGTPGATGATNWYDQSPGATQWTGKSSAPPDWNLATHTIPDSAGRQLKIRYALDGDGLGEAHAGIDDVELSLGEVDAGVTAIDTTQPVALAPLDFTLGSFGTSGVYSGVPILIEIRSPDGTLTSVNEVFGGTLPFDGIANVTSGTLFDWSAPGAYTVTVTTQLPFDTDASNDSFTETILVGSGPSAATLDVNGSALNAAGNPISSGESGPYFADVQVPGSILIRITGQPNQPVILFGGDLDPGGTLIGGVGFIDIQTPATVIGNGTNPGPSNLFFNTDPSGVMELGATLPFFLAGTAFTYQAAVMSPKGFDLTNSVEATFFL